MNYLWTITNYNKPNNLSDEGEIRLKLFRETEYDKINEELLGKHFPKQIAEDYYCLGQALAIKNILTIFRNAVESKFNNDELLTLINGFENSLKEAPEIYRLYERLKKDK